MMLIFGSVKINKNMSWNNNTFFLNSPEILFGFLQFLKHNSQKNKQIFNEPLHTYASVCLQSLPYL